MKLGIQKILERRAKPLSPRVRLALLIVSGLGLLVAMVWAWDRSELAFDDLRWVPIAALFFVAAPLSVLLRSAEFLLAARISNQHPERSLIIETAVVSSAANLLPLPGSFLVTVRTLAGGGASYPGAVTAGALPGLTWLGLTGLVGGFAIATTGATLVGCTIIAAGLIVLAGTAVLFVRFVEADRRVRLAGATLAVEAGWLGVSALRFSLAIAALGLNLTLAQALSLSVAGALTVAIGFFPGGLGLREALIAALSPLIGLDVETGVLLGAIDHVVWLAFLALTGGVLIARRSQSTNDTKSARASR